MLVNVHPVGLVLQHRQVIIQIFNIHQTQLRKYYLRNVFMIFFSRLWSSIRMLRVCPIDQIVNLLILYPVFIAHDVLYHRTLIRIQLGNLTLALNVNAD